MQIKYANFCFNQRGTKIDLSHFIEQLTSLNGKFIPFNKFSGDEFDTGIDSGDSEESGISIHTEQDESHIYGLIASVDNENLKKVPTIKNGIFSLENATEGLVYINFFIVSKQTGFGAFSHYKNSLSIHDFRRALNTHYDSIDKKRNSQNIIRPYVGYENFLNYIQHNFERIDVIEILERTDKYNKHDKFKQCARFSQGSFIENTRSLKVRISSGRQNAFFKYLNNIGITGDIIRVAGTTIDHINGTSISKYRNKSKNCKLDFSYEDLLDQMLCIRENFPQGFTQLGFVQLLKENARLD